ncbi:MAG: 50S ribosomal protein L11 methyltransferase [Gammaproteobacteria bacterium]
MHYLQLAVTTSRKDADLVCEWMGNEGALSVTVESANEQECFDEAAPGDPSWELQRLTALFDSELDGTELKNRIAGLPVVDSARVTRLEQQDWERSWLDNFKPIQVSEKMWICPSWLTPPHPDAVNLIIDPGLAFGTGAHATTFQILEYLSSQSLSGKTIVDYGCGSGILGIAAIALGAHKAIGVDIDPKALQAATHNAHINGVEQCFEVVPADQFDINHAGLKAEVVIANILIGALLALRQRLTDLVASGGVLVLSGLLENQVEQIEASYGDDFEFDRFQQQEWIVLIGTGRQRG